MKFTYRDIFSDYRVKPYKDPINYGDAWDVNYDELNRLRRNGYSDLTEYFMYFRCQMNFAMHCATTALGISHEHLTQGSELLKSFYSFHVMYHIRRVLYLLNSPIPGDKEFKKYDNYFNHEAYLKICSEYGVNPNLNGLLVIGHIQLNGVCLETIKKRQKHHLQIIIAHICL